MIRLLRVIFVIGIFLRKREDSMKIGVIGGASSGTYVDTLRFRLQIARRPLGHPSSVDALVFGEHWPIQRRGAG